MILYNLKDIGPSYRITKFDEDLNPSTSYLVSATSCECPQGHRPTCRHRKMLPAMLDRIDTSWFYCFDTSTWHDPTGAYAPAAFELEPSTASGEGYTPGPTTERIRRRI